MHIFPSNEEIEEAANLLVTKYKVSPQLLGQIFGTKERDQANDILYRLTGTRLTALDVARLLIQREGPALFSGSQATTRKLRLHLLKKLSDEKVVDLFNRHPVDNGISFPSHMRKPLSEKKWHTGKNWAKDFIAALSFPAIFAGVVQPKKVPTIQDVPPRKVPPALVDFQSSLKERMYEVLTRDDSKTRCVVCLPTGGGKTRVAVEAFIDWLHPRFAEGKYLIWIAQSEELCEQAIACIEQMWSSREFVYPLRIYRFFGGREISSEDELCGGVVVASIQQVHNRIKLEDKILENILKNSGAMIIDEAHRAVSQMYNAMLDKARSICGHDLFPICGLTATPGRAGMSSQQETVRLVGQFEAYLIKPDLGDEYEKNPLKYFRDHEFIARANHVLYNSQREYVLTDDELNEMKKLDDDLPPGFLKRLAADQERNLLIVRKMLSLPKNKPTLVYACTVKHAFFLSGILNSRGKKSAAVSSDTPMTLRRALIHDFKNGKLDFLCNFGVLTTGFDAPKTEFIVLCRPTTSVVLYEQIIGRGLRGPRFNGTQDCTIIDFADNIRRLGPPLAYARFVDYWNEDRTEDLCEKIT